LYCLLITSHSSGNLLAQEATNASNMSVSLHKKTGVFIVAALACFVAIFMLALHIEERRQTGIMQSQLQGKSAELDRQLSRFVVVPRLLAQNPRVIGALQNDTASVLIANRTLLKAQLDSSADFVFLLNANGTTVASSNFREDVSFVGRNYSFRPYFKEALAGMQSTFFAVGATTGIPGYFVAEPVILNTQVVGVLVVKFELSGLFDSWELAPYDWLALDEFGVVILSTDPQYLFSPTLELSKSTIQTIASNKTYSPSSKTSFRDLSGAYTEFMTPSGNRSFYTRSADIHVENWQLQLIMGRSDVVLRALFYLLGAISVASVFALVYHMMNESKRIAETEKHYTMQLEHEIEQRTAELHSAQQQLISESNFAMLGRMSAAINHEINQPLASLRLNLAALRNLIERPDPDSSEVRQIVLDSDRTTKRIGRVVTTLRNLTGQRRTERSVVQIPTLVAEVVDTLNRERPQISACLSVEVPNVVPTIIGNDVLLQQALLNLLYNAYDAVIDHPEPSVTLRVETHDKEYSTLAAVQTVCQRQ